MGGGVKSSALTYASRGTRVFPLRAHEKTPVRGMHWKQEATTNPGTIKRWWDETWPTANCGVACGPSSHLVAFDIDPRHNGSLEAIMKAFGELPETPTVLTGGGGLHKLFAHPAEDIPSLTILPGVEVKGAGRYIVGAGSIHPNGNAYRWAQGLSLEDVELAPLPDAFLEFLLKPPHTTRGLREMGAPKPWVGNGALRQAPHELLAWALRQAIPHVNRHIMALRLSLRLRSAGVSKEAAYTILEDYARLVPEPESYSVQDALATVTWAYTLTDLYTVSEPVSLATPPYLIPTNSQDGGFLPTSYSYQFSGWGKFLPISCTPQDSGTPGTSARS
jgi:hypothetical protein